MTLASATTALLKRKLTHNVPEFERAFSAYSGVRLIGRAFARHGLGRLILLGAGAAMVCRAWTGHCPLYEELANTKANAQTTSAPPVSLDKEHGSEV